MSELQDILEAGQCPECKRLTAEVGRLGEMLEDSDIAEVNAFHAGWTMYADNGLLDRLPDDMATAMKHYLSSADSKLTKTEMNTIADRWNLPKSERVGIVMNNSKHDKELVTGRVSTCNQHLDIDEGNCPWCESALLLALLDRIEIEKDHTLAKQRFDIARELGYTVVFGEKVSGRKQ